MFETVWRRKNERTIELRGTPKGLEAKVLFRMITRRSEFWGHGYADHIVIIA